MGKQKTQQAQTNTYQYMTPPSTPDIDAVRASTTAHLDPTVAYRAAGA
jgi:hypothetical protein